MSNKPRIFKECTLMRYAAAGYLDWNSQKVSALERVSAGVLLYQDAVLGGVVRSRVVDPSRIRVDGGGSGEQSEFCVHHLDLYNKAMSAVPSEFWPVVRKVCVDDEPIEATGTRLDVKRKFYAARIDLCRGLDRLAEFYFKKNKFRVLNFENMNINDVRSTLQKEV